MAVPHNGKSLGVIGSISKFAGALVGTAVATGKQIIGSATPPGKGPSDRDLQALAKIKKKVVTRKPAGSSGKSGTSKKKPTQPPAKKKKATTPKKKPIRRKAKDVDKNKVSGQSKDGPVSETGAETSVEKQKSQS
jgi:hypothetical protein